MMAASLTVWGANPAASTSYTAGERAAIKRHVASGSHPLPDPTDRVADSRRAASLGQYLFFDRRLSANGKFSCASCHQPQRAFTDGRRVGRALGVDPRNTPTVINAVDGHWFFWDGRADSLWSQALYVMEDPRELGSDRAHIAHVVASHARLRQAYKQVFGALPPLHDGQRFPAHASPHSPKDSERARAWQRMSEADHKAVNRVFSNVGKALEAYQRRLMSRGSPFDRYAKALLAGKPDANELMSPAARRGLKLFVGRARCDLCHSGKDFSDGQFHNIGLPRLAGEPLDTGREAGIRKLLHNPFNAGGAYSDRPKGHAGQRLQFLPSPESMRGAFKTPTLRNVARSAPYFHDGRFSTLQQVVSFYAQGAGNADRVVGKRERTLDLIPHLTKAQIHDLVAFLNTLNSAPFPASLTKPPARP